MATPTRFQFLFVWLLIVATLVALFLIAVGGCSGVQPSQVVLPSPGVCGLGDTQEQECPAGMTGKVTQVCTAQGWKQLAACVPEGVPVPSPSPVAAPSFLDLNYVESNIVSDLQRVPPADRITTRYLVTAHAFDAGLSPDLLKTWQQAMDKGLNCVSPISQNLFNVQPIDPAQTIWRVATDSFDLQEGDLASIEASDPVNIVSQTTEGLIAQALTGTLKPWFHADNFLDIVYRNSDIYYKLVNIPSTLAAFQQQLGINFNQDVATFKANFIGISASPTGISEQKNRLLVRVAGTAFQDAFYWQTFDTNANFIAQKNLFQFPLLAAAGGQENFLFDASEILFNLPNGLMGSALFDAQGNRLNSADPNVVIDTQTPLGNKVINNANSCLRCHSAGLIPAADEILAHVTSNATQFIGNDVQLVQALYAPSLANQGLFAHDNGVVGAQLAKLGVDPTAPDPISKVTDRFNLNWDLKQVAAFLFLTPDQATTAINTSSLAKANIGQLLTGGSVTKDTFLLVLPQLIKDARLFQDPLGIGGK